MDALGYDQCQALSFSRLFSVNAFIIDVEERGNYNLSIPKDHQSLVYLLKGKVTINETEDLELNKNQMVWFNQDGEGFSIKGVSKSKLLISI